MPPLLLRAKLELRAARRSRRRSWLTGDLAVEGNVIQRVLARLVQDQDHALNHSAGRNDWEGLTGILQAQPIGRPISGILA